MIINKGVYKHFFVERVAGFELELPELTLTLETTTKGTTLSTAKERLYKAPITRVLSLRMLTLAENDSDLGPTAEAFCVTN